MTTDRNRARLWLFSLSLCMLAAPRSGRAQPFPNNLVSGTVTFQGAPLAGVTITGYNTNTSSVTQVTTTDDNGNYSLQLPAWINTTGTASADYHVWAYKPGYGFYPSMGSGATITRADHTWDFMGNHVNDVPIYFTVIHYVALPDPADRRFAGPPLTGANFSAYDGTNPLVSLAAIPNDPARIRGAVWNDRFTDNQDGTVTDGLTGLVWLKDAGCFSPTNWNNALAEVNALASGACSLTDGSAAGDWRLPNLKELESLVDVSASHPALTPGHPFINVSEGIYWSSTSYFGGQLGSPGAWAIRFSDGRYMNDAVSDIKATAANQVWAVKGSGAGVYRLQSTGMYVTFAAGDDGSIQSGVPPTYPRWMERGDGTVVDAVTGLVWLKQADCIKDTWTGAMAAVDALSSGQCGLSDGSTAGTWRMPTRAEMQSLSDRMQNNHADFFSHTFFNLDGTVYQPAIFNNFNAYQYYWTSSADAADGTKAWTVFSCDFGVYDTLKESVGYTLAVRVGPEPARSAREPGLVTRRGAW